MSVHGPLAAPRLFLSCAGSDRDVAERMASELGRHGIDATVDHWCPPGANWVLWINDAMAAADFYILLWSAAARDQAVVAALWSAALVRELAERSSYLLVVRLDDSALPPVLAPRHSLDGTHGRWSEVVRDLAGIWRRDRAGGAPPAVAGDPVAPEATGVTAPTRMIRVRNQVLGFAVVLAVAETMTGWELLSLIRARLALPDEQTRFAGQVGLRFRYRLGIAGEPLPEDPAALLHLSDGALVDLEVVVEPFGPVGPMAGTTSYRPATSGAQVQAAVPPAAQRALVRSAFRHLAPPTASSRAGTR
ncbi:toll/interleukin-1 receptor domain-containing protein [Frankia canadensis]|nr:toll/interleukin-1 receptor domain-containing protein [Frankia canadensis]